MAHRIALATNDGLTVFRHFGQADRFQVVDVLADAYEVVETRSVPPPCQSGSHDENAFDAVLEILSDCEALFVGKIGPGASEYLAEKGVRVFEVPGAIEKILANVTARDVLGGFARTGRAGIGQQGGRGA